MAGLRDFLRELDEAGQLVHFKRQVSTRFEIPAIMERLDGRAVLFTQVMESKDYRVAGGVCSSRELLATALAVPKEKLFQRIAAAIDDPKPFQLVDDAPCQEVIEDHVDVRKLPILTHYPRDGGPFVTAGIVVAYDKEYGYNASYHRLMPVSRDSFAIRILPRHLDEFIRRGNRDIAVTIGNHPAFLVAAAVSCEIGKSELEIANALAETRYAKCTSNDVVVPADCELVLEGVITDEYVDEGPFMDLTGTYDIVRKQRILKVTRITHRRQPIYQALLSSGNEHKLLMGLPREATIFREVNRVCECLEVRLTMGGCSWLHAVVKIAKRNEEDGKHAIEATFRGHPSLKHVVIVDEDVDLNSLEDVEWSIATRVQMDRDLVLMPGQLGSSLDPSADRVARRTCKAGLDATIPSLKRRRDFMRDQIPGEDTLKLEDYL